MARGELENENAGRVYVGDESESGSEIEYGFDGGRDCYVRDVGQSLGGSLVSGSGVIYRCRHGDGNVDVIRSAPSD